MRSIFSVVWASFVVAVFSSIVFILAVDPAAQLSGAGAPMESLRLHAYVLGFALFWALALMGGLFTRLFAWDPVRASRPTPPVPGNAGRSLPG